ncbi:MAG: ABC transporter ATP-binding protein [Thermomicrobiales bacterium]
MNAIVTTAGHGDSATRASAPVGRIAVRHVGQRFGETAALDDVTFTIEPNRITGLLGRNGSGKTTLLSIMAAFRKPDTGGVFIDGDPLFENPVLTSQIAFIREGGDTVEGSEKVSEAFRYAAWLRPNWDADYAARLVETFQLPVKQRIDRLSRGQRSALGIILGLAARTPIAIFDETYLGLDAPSRYAFADAVLADYMEQPRTFILSTHLIEEMASLFESVLILDRGRVLVHRDTEDLLAEGTAVTGPADQVDAFTAGMRVIGRRSLGRTASATVMGPLDTDQRRRATADGLDLAPVALQDLFVHLTGGAPVASGAEPGEGVS